MLSKRIIACLDVRDGKVVKGINFEDLREAGDPAALARRYNVEGIDELVMLDVTATIEQRQARAQTIQAVAREIFLPLTVGGGIRSREDIRKLLRAGADKVSVNTSAVQRPEVITEIAGEFGSQCVVCAIDARGRAEGGWEVYLHGGRTPTGIDAVEWCERGVSLGGAPLSAYT